jgi:DNA-binding NtrC family response regulator
LSFRVAKERAVARWERDFVEMLLSRNSGNVSSAAREARMDRNHLRELVRKHRLRAGDGE